MVALVDDDDFEELSKWKWHRLKQHPQTATPVFYVCRHDHNDRGQRTIILLHRQILNAPKGSLVDHINRDPLDNRRCNLRLVNYHQNALNRAALTTSVSKLKGVTFRGALKSKRWEARITVDTKIKSLGLYATPEEAHRVYLEAANKYHGEYAAQGLG